MARASWSALLALALALLPGCASKRPVLYPNAQLQQAGTELAEEDVRDCMRFAEDQVGRENAGARVAADTTRGGGTGAAIGAAGGAVRGRAGPAAAVGAAMGATAGLLRGLFRARDPDPIFRNTVQLCLSERGYRVVGWR